MDYCGNVNFVKYNATPENIVTQLCKQFLEESLCSVVKQYVKYIFSFITRDVYV